MTAQAKPITIAPDRYEDGKELLIAGMSENYTMKTMSGIPAQWQRFAPHIGKIPGRVGRVAYGVCIDMADGFAYMTGVEVSNASNLPAGLTTMRVPPRHYAVFRHQGHVSTIPDTMDVIWHGWVKQSHAKPAGPPAFFERYGEKFNPATGKGDIEIWVPVQQ